MSSQLRSYADFSSLQRHIVGDTKTSYVSEDHLGWLLCDGREVLISEFPRLYRVIGNTYGVPSEEGYFVLPNASGRVIGNVGNAGVSGETWIAGDISGAETHILTIAEMPAHNHGTDASNTVVGNNLTGISGEHSHTYTDTGHTHSEVGPYTPSTLAIENDNPDTSAYVNTQSNTSGTNTPLNITINPYGNHQHTIATQGGGQEHNNIQPTLFFGNLFIYSGTLHNRTSTAYPVYPPNFSKGIW